MHYNCSESGSIDLLEVARAKYYELEKNPSRHTSYSGFLQGPLCPIDQEYVLLNIMTTDLVSFATPHYTFPRPPPLISIVDRLEPCVCCKTLMHTSYECDAYRQKVKQVLEIKSKNPQSVLPDAIGPRPCAGPWISTKRLPEKDS